MEEIVREYLENEMDLILANNRTMKLAELCGLSPALQTGLATAVAEIARCALSSGRSLIRFGISSASRNRKQVSVIVCSTTEACGSAEAFGYAERLITEIRMTKGDGSSWNIQLDQDIRFSGLITESKIKSFVEYFKREPPLSPYDEIRRKGIQLLEFSRKLEESENKYRNLAETLPLMMFVANPHGDVIYTNQWLKNYLGEKLTTIKPGAVQALMHPGDHAALNRDWAPIFKAGNSFRAQARLRNKRNGTYLWHLISISPVKNEKNEISQWTGFFADIHAQKEVEETLKDNAELKEAKKKLVAYRDRLEEKVNELNVSNGELEQFAFIASHDLQEPLRKIATFSTLLVDRLPELDNESRLYFSKIISSSDQMTNQIKDVLDWSRVGRAREEFEPVDLNEIMTSIESDLDMLVQQKKAVIGFSRLPVIRGMRIQMIQLFGNLIGNALKFCDTAPVITINSRNLNYKEIVARKKLDSSISYAEVTVTDNGIGFSGEYAEQIFKIFQRLNGHDQFKGTGIGLAICKKIAQNHKGEIYAAGSPGQGAVFTIILPTS